MNETDLSRRKLMKLGAGALVAGGVWPGALAAADVASSDFSFVVMNDLHYIDDGCRPFFVDAVKKMKAAAPAAKLALIVGDTCENGTDAQVYAIRDILRTLGMDLRIAIGNHDWATDTDRRAFEQAWPDALNYTFDHGGWQLVVLDTTDGTRWKETAIQKPTFDWLDEHLPRLEPRRPTVLVTHFPLGEGVTYRPTNADALLERFKPFNLRGVLNGHYHAFTERKGNDFLITTNRCCSFRRNNHDGTLEKGFFVCKITDGKLTREFVEVSKVQAPA